MRLGRSLEGLALLAVLAPQYLVVLRLRRWWRGPAQAWRGRLDRLGGAWLASYARRRGALLVKIGQFVATRPDLFPLPYVDACAELRDQAPPRPWSSVRAVLDEAYEGRHADHFQQIDEVPLAAASFGQVHRAVLADGSPVAVKVQHGDLGPLVAADLWLVRRALALFRIALPGWPLDQVRQEIERTAHEEMDYLQEGANADRLRETLAGIGIRVPVVHWHHTRERVLVMEFATGTTLARLDPARLTPEARRALADRIIDGFLAQLLDAGFFHADPHGGNLIHEVVPDAEPRLWLIDFGMTATITPREIALYRRFLSHLREDDTDGMVDCLVELGFVLPTADRAKLKAIARDVYDQLGHLDPRSFKGSKRQTELAARINEFLRRIDGVVFPMHTLLLSRATGLIEGLCTQLVPGSSFLDLVKPRLAKASWTNQVEAALAGLRETWNRWRRLPDRLEESLEQIRQGQQTAGSPLALVCAVLLVGALLLEPGAGRIIVAIAAGGGLIAALLMRR